MVSARTRFVFNTLRLDRPGQQRLVQPVDRRLAAAGGDLHQRRRMRHPPTERDPTEPLPRDRVGHLPTQRLEPEPVAVLQEHQPQIRLDRDRRPPQRGMEELAVRREEPLVVQQPIDPHQLGRHHQRLRRQQRLPQRRLIAYRSQHRWLRSVLALRVGAIIPDQTTSTRGSRGPLTRTFSGRSS